MPGALAKHAVQAKPDEQGNQGEDDDDGQFSSPNRLLAANIVRVA